MLLPSNVIEHEFLGSWLYMTVCVCVTGASAVPPDPFSDDDSDGSGTVAGDELCSSEFSDEEAGDRLCSDEAEDPVFEAPELFTAGLDACESSEGPFAEKICTVLSSFFPQPESKTADRHTAIMSFLFILNISPNQLSHIAVCTVTANQGYTHYNAKKRKSQ